MSKCPLVRVVAGALFALVAAYAPVARAGEVVSNDVFSSGVSFERYPLGSVTALFPDDPSDPAARNFYWGSETVDDVQGFVGAYHATTNVPYDYAVHDLERSPYLTNDEPTVTRYLALDTAKGGFSRSIFERPSPADVFSNVVVRTGTRDSIYCDMLVKFTPDDDAPVYGSSSRIVVWAREKASDDGSVATNLMVTAGFYTNQFKTVLTRDFCLDSTEALPGGVDCGAWHRVTIRAHGDVSSQGVGLSCFSIYLDGKPLRGIAGEYGICASEGLGPTWLTPEARALEADRRLFPSMATPGSDEAYTMSGLTFVGNGALDDLTFSSEHPGFGRPESVFTLNWDVGVKSLSYTLDGGRTTKVAPTATARSADILLEGCATNGLVLRVLECVYDKGNGYGAGVWLGSNGATLTNGTEFVFDGTTRNPIATVASTCDSVHVGPGDGGFDTFDSAFAYLDRSTNAVKVIELTEDTVVPVSNVPDAYGNFNRGYVCAMNPDGEYVLDLKGHWLRGQLGKKPTLVVGCKSFRIRDSSEGKTGRILPVDSYENPNTLLNTSVLVAPQVGKVEPVLTIQDGFYDGWVRNQVSVWKDTSVSGAIFVEGGSYVSTNAETFYLDSCVTNPATLFTYGGGYWSGQTDETRVIWAGRGDGRNWQDPDNWKRGSAPTAEETAYFPVRAAGEGPWTVDVGANMMSTKKLWLAGDVSLSGTNDFAGVTLNGEGSGRICGDATLVYEGELPGKLTETLLRDDWTGAVVLRDIGCETSKTTIPKVLDNLETWGLAGSRVVFNGVRGYVMDARSHTMPYGLVLRDLVVGSVTNAAWQNDSGYTGSTLAFTGALTGDGTFSSGENKVSPILQLFKFADVHEFRGRFDVRGKRVLIGSETVMASDPGLIAFGDSAVVNSGLGWSCRRAVFGSTLHAWGETNDVLVTCTEAEPDVSVCANLTLNGYSGVAWLACTNEPKWTVFLSDRSPSGASASSVGASLAPAVTSTSASGGSAYATAVSRAQALAFAPLAPVVVSNAVVSLSVGDGKVVVTVSDAKAGYYYGIRHRASLDEDWDEQASVEWRLADGPTLSFEFEQTEDRGFYCIEVLTADPNAGGGE